MESAQNVKAFKTFEANSSNHLAFGTGTTNRIQQTFGLRLHISEEMLLLKKAKAIIDNRLGRKDKKIKHCQSLKKERADSETLLALKVHDSVWSKSSRSEKREYIRQQNLKTLERNIHLGQERVPLE